MSLSSLSILVRNIVNKVNNLSINRQNLNYTRMTYVSNETKHYATKYMQILGIDTSTMVVSPITEKTINIYLPSNSVVGHTLFIRHEYGDLGKQSQEGVSEVFYSIKLHYVDSTQQSGFSFLGKIEEKFGSSMVYFNGEKWIHIN